MRTAAGPRTANGIGVAADEVRRVHDQAQAARSKRLRMQRLIRWTDAMIEELELENIRETHRVSAAWWPRLVILFSSLPFDVGLPRRRPRTPVEVLNLVYAVQARLFAFKRTGVRDPRPSAHWM
jgi:hypothetical protein